MSLIAQLAREHVVRKDVPVVVRLDVTPAMAREFLQHNVTNRPLSPAQVDKYAFDMNAEGWTETHQTIAFNRRLELIDGQHRLNAVIKVGRPVTLLAMFNVNADYYAPIDRGRPRSLADITREKRRAVSTVTALMPLAFGEGIPVTHVMVRRVLGSYRDSIDWVMKNVPQQRGMNANILAAFVYAHAVEPRAVAAFVDRFRDRDGAGASPVGAFMKLLDGTSRATGHQAALHTLRCLELFMKGRKAAHVTDIKRGRSFFLERHARKGGTACTQAS